MTAPSSPSVRRQGRPSPLVLTIIAVVALVALFVIFAQVYTNVLWYQQLGFLQVWTTEWETRAVLFAVGFTVMSVVVWFPMWFSHRTRPVYPPTTPRQENLDRYRTAIEPLRRLFTIALPAVVGVLGGLALAAGWKQVQLFLHQTPFGDTDAQFGHDIGFYVFDLPILQLATGFLGMAALLSLVAGIVGHYLMGGIRPGEERGVQFTRAARIHLSITAAVLVLSQAARLFVQRYADLTDQSGLIPGATYTAANVTLPAMLIVSLAAVVVAAVLAANAFRKVWRLSVVAVVMLFVLGAVSVIALPAAVQQFQVQPSEQNLENEYIQRNIDATRKAYGIDDVDVIPYTPKTDAQSGALRADAQTAASIRLLDPNLVSDTFRQLQQQRSFYSFPSQLDVDRYKIDGQNQDTVIAVRELNAQSQADASWLNQAVVYTHGFGVVSAYGNRQTTDGQPAFSEANIPPTGELGEYEPRVYFGEQSPRYSIVGAEPGGQAREIDYPADKEDGGAQVYNTFSGNGGPSVGNFFIRLLYAIKFQDEQIVLSDAMNSKSQILYDRSPRERVQKAAPFLQVDGDPYPAVVDGRIKWIVDGYTTSAQYPYSKSQVLQEATADSNTQRSNNTTTLPNQQANYIRNSVKATVDAYDGKVELYDWDEKDPILETWSKAFPGLFKPVSEMSADLLDHVRYPEDLFKVQRSLLTQYHVADANSFYTKQDFWASPSDPTLGNDQRLTQPPYYLTLKMPNQEQPSFSLTSSFIPRQIEGQTRNNLTGFLSASADAGGQAGKKGEGYGKLRLLQLPRNTSFPGPGQAQNNFNTEPDVQRSLNLLRQGESKVQNGNLLTLPVAGGLLYVQPVYVRSAGQTSYPVLKTVLVAFGEKIGFAPTLDEALDQVFGGNSGANAGDSNQAGKKEDQGTGSSDASSGSQDRSPDLQQALEDAKKALEDSDSAMRSGDWTKYGEAQSRLKKALTAAENAQKK